MAVTNCGLIRDLVEAGWIAWLTGVIYGDALVKLLMAGWLVKKPGWAPRDWPALRLWPPLLT